VAQNQLLGEVEILGKTKIDKTSGVWVDGQYLGYVEELTGDKKILLLPGDHEIDVRQAGYIEQGQKITVEPGKKTTINVSMQLDPKAQFPTGVTSQVKLHVTPDRAAVFVDDAYVERPKSFGGVGRAMVIAPGRHHVKNRSRGYQDFTTEVNLRPSQKDYDQDGPHSRKHHAGGTCYQEQLGPFFVEALENDSLARLNAPSLATLPFARVFSLADQWV